MQNRKPLELVEAPSRLAVHAIICVAMNDELAGGLDFFEEVGEKQKLGVGHWQLARLSGREILLVQSGIGLVNAATSLTLALSRFSPRYLFSCGSAGGLSPQARVGQVVVGSTYTYASADATIFDYVLGQIPQMPAQYEGDDNLLSRAATLGLQLGQMLSSDMFVTAKNLEEVRAKFPRAYTTDMESTALAQVAWRGGLPFVSVRAISDLCGPKAGEENHRDAQIVSHASFEAALKIAGLL